MAQEPKRPRLSSPPIRVNTRPRENLPFTDEALPQILRFVELDTKRTWAKRIPGLRNNFEKTRPAPIKKVIMAYKEREGTISVNIDGEEIKQQVGQPNNDFFEIIKPRIFNRDIRIEKLIVKPNHNNFYDKLEYFTEMPLVKKFKMRGSTNRFAFLSELRPVEATFVCGVQTALPPIQNARVIKFEFMVGNWKTMKFLRNALATKWDATVSLDDDCEDDWVFEKFASGVMEIGSIYKGHRNCSHEPFLQRMLQKYPEVVRTEEEEGKVKYMLKLPNGSRLMSWEDDCQERQKQKHILIIEIVKNETDSASSS